MPKSSLKVSNPVLLISDYHSGGKDITENEILKYLVFHNENHI